MPPLPLRGVAPHIVGPNITQLSYPPQCLSTRSFLSLPHLGDCPLQKTQTHTQVVATSDYVVCTIHKATLSPSFLTLHAEYGPRTGRLGYYFQTD